MIKTQIPKNIVIECIQHAFNGIENITITKATDGHYMVYVPTKNVMARLTTIDKIYHGHKLWQGGGIVEIIASPMPAKNNCLAYEIHFRDCIEIVDE